MDGIIPAVKACERGAIGIPVNDILSSQGIWDFNKTLLFPSLLYLFLTPGRVYE